MMARAAPVERTPEYYPVLHVIGLFVTAIGVLMLIPAAADWLGDNVDWQVFAVSAMTTVFLGTCLSISTRGPILQFNLHQGFMLTTGLWLAAAATGAVPLMFSRLNLSFTDAFFEAMSGLTTTGSTVITGLDHAPPGLLLWRGLLQWLGGIGFIAVGLIMLPFLRVGGMQLFRLESSEKSEKAVPQARRFALLLLLIYTGMTFACALLLGACGMSSLDAAVHAMATLSTGGFGTRDASLAYFDSAPIDGIVTLFMVLGGLPFILYLRALQGRPRLLLRDEQVRSYLRFLIGVTLFLTLSLWLGGQYPLPSALRFAAFNVVSVTTTTGFVTADYSAWGSMPVTLFFLLLFMGGCTGSTAGGLKAFRFDLIGLCLRIYVSRLIYPHGTFARTYNGRTVTDDVFAGVLLFMGVYLISTAVVGLMLAMCGLDLVTSISGAATAIGNVGPGLGPIIGPAGNFASLPDAAKWILAFAMLLGRLEIFTVFALFAPSFWRQ